MKAQISKCVKIYVRGSGLEWAVLRLEESTGFVCIASDFGHWVYHWIPRHRSSSLGSFLSGVHIDYAGSKFLGSGLREYSQEKTYKTISELILSLRRSNDLSKDDARSEWDNLVYWYSDGRSFESWYEETNLPDVLELQSFEINSSWKQFWERIWIPLIVPVLKQWPVDKDEAIKFESQLEGN